MDGLAMLIAWLSASHWTGIDADAAVMRKALKKAN
jgi:hypothetical protein